MKYDWGDSWDGFDGSEHVYDEKKERGFRTGIWKVLCVIMAFMVIYLVNDHIKEIRFVDGAKVIEAHYYENSRSYARYMDENGQYYIFNLSAYIPEHDADTVKMYYRDDIRYARPRNSIGSRIFYYFFFGGLLLISIWRIRKNG